MKVIGKSEGGYLISATETEIAQLFGHGHPRRDEFKATAVEAGAGKSGYDGIDLVGMQINVGVAYERLAWLERRKREFDGLVRSLRQTADKIDDHRPLFDKIAGDAD